MGSIGSGSLCDFHGCEGVSDQCAEAFTTALDEVASGEFFMNTKTIPADGTAVKVVFDKRLLVVDRSYLCIGFLPSKFNYLRACMCDGFTYEGIINKGITKPVPYIIVDLKAVKL